MLIDCEQGHNWMAHYCLRCGVIDGGGDARIDMEDDDYLDPDPTNDPYFYGGAA